MGATAGIALQAGSMFSSFAQSRQQAGIARTQGNYSGAIADQNAGLSDRQATDAIARGDESANRLALSGRQLAGAQKAAAAGDGVDPNSGSAAELQADTGALSAFDANTIRANAAREAWGFGVDAANQRAAGANARLAGENEANALTTKSYSTLLTNGANLADQWRQNPPTFGKVGAQWRNRNMQATSPAASDATDAVVQRLQSVPGVQQSYNAASKMASTDYSGIVVRQPKAPVRSSNINTDYSGIKIRQPKWPGR